jgi:hypothetical protein
MAMNGYGALPVCDRCGDEIEVGAHSNPETGVMCDGCYRLLARIDMDPDGEAFRGGEAAAYEREQQDECQRDLK